MQTTESGKAALDLNAAADLLVQDDTETEELVSEEEVEQPEEDSTDDSEETGDDEVGDDVEDDEESESDDEDYEDVEEDAEDSEPSEKLYTVKVDGDEKRVTLDELMRGYSGQQYVQKGMQQVAEARKQAEGAYQALMQERQGLAQLVQQAQQGALAPPVEPSKESYKHDFIGYMEAKLEYDDKLKAYSQAQAQIQQVMQQQTQAEIRAREAYAHQEAQKLLEVIPELRDPKKATAFKEKLVKAATDFYGYTPEEIANISSYRDFLVIRDAMKYREIVAGKDAVQQKAKKARPVVKPGAKKVTTNGDVVRKQQNRLKKTGSIEDALSLMIGT